MVAALGQTRLCRPRLPTVRLSFHCRHHAALPRTAAWANCGLMRRSKAASLDQLVGAVCKYAADLLLSLT
jgi:hypothetical protein